VRNGNFLWKFGRVTWRAWLAIICWFVPVILEMAPADKEKIQQAAVALLVASLVSWAAQQGRRRPPSEGSEG
jgi:hypothetical protein